MDEPDLSADAQGAAPGHGGLVRRHAEIAARRTAALARVDGLVRSQRELSETLGGDLRVMKAQGEALEHIQGSEPERGLLASITRTLTRRNRLLERQSVAQQLFEQYARVNEALGRASAFSDELELCAAEMQREVDQLHEAAMTATRDEQEALTRRRDAQAEIARISAVPVAGEGGDRARRLDQLEYEARALATSGALHRAAAAMNRQELGPARALRDTVQSLHEDMAQYVLDATVAIGAAGRRIQALGLAADAPLVVADLQDSMEQLDTAMLATEAYVRQAHELLTQVLPSLSERIRAGAMSSAAHVQGELDAIGDDRARERAEQALRDAAVAEIERLGAE